MKKMFLVFSFWLLVFSGGCSGISIDHDIPWLSIHEFEMVNQTDYELEVLIDGAPIKFKETDGKRMAKFPPHQTAIIRVKSKGKENPNYYFHIRAWQGYQQVIGTIDKKIDIYKNKGKPWEITNRQFE